LQFFCGAKDEEGFVRMRKLLMVVSTARVTLHAVTAASQTKGTAPGQGVVFVVIHEMGPAEAREYALQPGWVARQGKIQKLDIADYRNILAFIYASGKKELRVPVSDKPQKVWIGCNDYLVKSPQTSPGSAAFASSAIKEALNLANAACR
jgi:hypothetical protein